MATPRAHMTSTLFVAALALLMTFPWRGLATMDYPRVDGVIERYSGRSRSRASERWGQGEKRPPYTATASWGYVEVRPLAHMFWWLQPYKQLPLEETAVDTPLVIWLQGGPGASGTGFGQFTEVGPYDMDGNARKFAWTERAHVLFVDNPVGTGFSYVEKGGSFATDNKQIGVDLVVLLEGVLEAKPALAGSPITIVCESYGGKMGVAFAEELLAVKPANKPKIKLNGLALGDSWISPVSYVLAWGPLLNDFSLLDSYDYETVAEAALDIQSSVSQGQWAEATDGWAKMEKLIESLTDNVNFYNLLQHNVPDINTAAAHPMLLSLWQEGRSATQRGGVFTSRMQRYLASYHNKGLAEFMNGEVKQALGSVIPAGVVWGGQAGQVSDHLKVDFMKDVTAEVDRLLDVGLNITVYNGQLDLICCTRGTELWLKGLKWADAKKFGVSPRTPLYATKAGGNTGAFYKWYKNLFIFYVMNAGHMVPSDTPEMALAMLEMIVGAL